MNLILTRKAPFLKRTADFWLADISNIAGSARNKTEQATFPEDIARNTPCNALSQNIDYMHDYVRIIPNNYSKFKLYTT